MINTDAKKHWIDRMSAWKVEDGAMFFFKNRDGLDSDSDCASKTPQISNVPETTVVVMGFGLKFLGLPYDEDHDEED